MLISDIHSNLQALEACLCAAPEHDGVANLGDTVGYGANPNEVIERSRGLGAVFVRGNHDKAASGLSEMEGFNPVATVSALWTRHQLTEKNAEWLRALPQGPVALEGLPGVLFVHGSPLDEDEYLVTQQDALGPLRATSAEITFFGHTHIQGVFVAGPKSAESHYPAYNTAEESESSTYPLEAGRRYLVNPGSIGQPRDSDWRAGFALFDSEKRTVTFYRVPYDIKKAQDDILAANLPSRLAARLAAGR